MGITKELRAEMLAKDIELAQKYGQASASEARHIFNLSDHLGRSILTIGRGEEWAVPKDGEGKAPKAATQYRDDLRDGVRDKLPEKAQDQVRVMLTEAKMRAAFKAWREGGNGIMRPTAEFIRWLLNALNPGVSKANKVWKACAISEDLQKVTDDYLDNEKSEVTFASLARRASKILKAEEEEESDSDSEESEEESQVEGKTPDQMAAAILQIFDTAQESGPEYIDAVVTAAVEGLKRQGYVSQKPEQEKETRRRPASPPAAIA